MTRLRMIVCTRDGEVIDNFTIVEFCDTAPVPLANAVRDQLERKFNCIADDEVNEFVADYEAGV